MLRKLIAFIIISATTGFAQTTTSYSWEDGGTILGFYGNLSNPLNVGSTSGVDPYGGSAMLSVSESPVSGTPQAYITFIENLFEGDVVSASFFGYDATPGESPSLRIWGGYALNGNINDYQGSAGGNDTYTDGTGWSQLNYTWTIASGKEALVIQARLYSGSDNPTVYFIDLVSVTAPATATVSYPTPPSLTADAGADQIVSVNTTGTLNGSSSEGDIVSWVWSQLTGLSVTINNSDQPIATFTAPGSTTSLTFQLTVTDNNNATDSDTVAVNVVDVSPGEVFISEYVEGSNGTQKYLEIYNNADSTVDLQSEGYSLKRTDDGDGDFSNLVFDNWGELNLLASGEVIVLAAEGSNLYSTPDTTLPYNSPLHFNGNDAVGLFRNDVLVDLIGDPNNSNDIIKDLTLQRNNNVTQPNPIFTLSEWTELPTNDVSGLGAHTENTNAPSVTDIAFTPDFITAATEITVSATIVPVTGSIASATILYGTDGNLLNEEIMSQESANLWMGIIPAQDGNILLDFKVQGTDDSGNSGESPVSSILIANTAITDIGEIHADLSGYRGQILTLQGIVTIGVGVLDDENTQAYLQDASGRGINLFDFDILPNMNRGDELMAVGYVEEYNNTVELVDFIHTRLSTGNALPVPAEISVGEANASQWEGTLIKFHGIVSARWSAGGRENIRITDGTDSTLVWIWYTTGIDTSRFSLGSHWWFTGVGSQFGSDYQLLVGYDEDIIQYLSINDEQTTPLAFALHPAYPNPFNPSTQVKWQLDRTGNHELAAYNLLGQKAVILSQGYFRKGNYALSWNAGNLPSGVYFIRLTSSNQQAVQKVMLIR